MLVAPRAWSEAAAASVDRGEPASRWQGRWYTASPAALGFESKRLTAAVSSIGRMRGVQGLLVARGGYLVEEHYWRGGARDKPHNLKSGSKSIISALVGIAISKGHFRLDQPIADLLPQARRLDDPVKRGITVYQLLTMTSGLESTSYEAYNDWVRNPDWITAALRRPLAAPPGTEYRYSTGNTHVLSAIISASTGKTTRKFAEQELFEPMGIEVAGWQKDPNGIHVGGNNFSLLPRDAVKLGQLYLDGGRWGDRQLIPRSWIAASTSPSENGAHETYGNYGFLWWTQPAEDGSFAAVGYGGQYIFVSPRHDSVIVVLSNIVSKGDRWEARLFDLLKRGVLGSLVDPSMPPSILLAAPDDRNRGRGHQSVAAIAATNVNLRGEPSLNATRLALVPEGSQLVLLERVAEWVRGRINGREGWLHWDYLDWLSLLSEQSDPTSIDWSNLDVERSKHEPASEDRSEVEVPAVEWSINERATDRQVDRTTNSLETRTSKVEDDTALIALRTRFDRIRADVQNLQALLSSASSLPRYRTAARINFRRSPSLNGAWLRIIEPETEFQALGTQGPWLKANIDGVEGWVHSDFVRTVESEPTVNEQRDLAAQLSAVGMSVRQLLETRRVSESGAADAKRKNYQLEQDLERTLARLHNVESERARLDREHRAKAEELVISAIAQKQRAQQLGAARKRIAVLEDSLHKEQSAKQLMATDLADLREALQAKLDELTRSNAGQEKRGMELDVARAQIDELELALKQEQATKQNLADELERTREQNDLQNRQLGHLGAEQERQNRELDRARAQIAKLEFSLAKELAAKQRLAGDTAHLQDDYRSQRQKLERALREQQVSKNTLVDALARLRTEHQILRQQLDELSAAEQQRAAEVESASAKVVDLERIVQQQRAEKQALADDLIRLSRQHRTQSEQLSRFDTLHKQDTTAMESARNQISELERALQQERAAKQVLATDRERLTAEHRKQSERLAQFDTAHEQHAAELDAARAQLLELERTLQQERTEKQTLAADLIRMREDRLRQSQQYARLDAEYKQDADELGLVRSQLSALEQVLQQELAAKQALIADVTRLTEERRAQSERLSQLDTARKADLAEMESARARVSELEQGLQQELAAKQTLIADVTRLREDNQARTQRLARLDALRKQDAKAREAARAGLAEVERLGSRVRESQDQRVTVGSEDVAKSKDFGYDTADRPTEGDLTPTASPTEAMSLLPEEAARSNLVAEINALVRAWAAAWSQQQVHSYLGFYSEDFRPAADVTRNTWEALRRRRLTRPSFIELSIADLDVAVLGPDRAQATFRQHYRADHYQDRVVKTLELAREDDRWRIVREASR